MFDPIDAMNAASVPGPRLVAEESLSTGAKSSEVASDGAEGVAAERPAACCRSRKKRETRTVVKLSQRTQHRDSGSEGGIDKRSHGDTTSGVHRSGDVRYSLQRMHSESGQGNMIGRNGKAYTWIITLRTLRPVMML